MRKIPLLTIVLSFIAIFRVAAQITEIPDEDFEQALIDANLDSGMINGEVPTANISGVEVLDLTGRNISNLQGIEDFVSLRQLEANNNNLTSINLNSNTALEFLDLNNNNLTSLNISNTQVSHLNIINNNLTSIVVNQTTIVNINCSDNTNLIALDLSSTTILNILNCDNGNLSTLDISSNDLNTLSCRNNQLTQLNVPSTSLRTLNCENNNLNAIEIFTNSGVNGTSLTCQNNQLTELTLSVDPNTLNTTNNPNLTCIQVQDAAAANVGTTAPYNAWNIDSGATFSNNCHYNETMIPDSNFEQALIDLNHDMVLDGYVSNSVVSVITNLDVSNKFISNLTGIAAFTSLTNLNCASNTLTALDISSNTDITHLNCSSNAITSLDVSNHTSLVELIFNTNQISVIDVSNHSSLTSFNATNNPNLTCINVSNEVLANNGFGIYAGWLKDPTTNYSEHCFETYVPDDNFEQALIDANWDTALDNYVLTTSISSRTILNIRNKSISDLTGIEGFTALQDLDARQNSLTSINLSSNTNLTTIRLEDNMITSLDLSNNTMLTTVRVNRNALTSLNLKNGNNPILNDVRAQDNSNLSCLLIDDEITANTNGAPYDGWELDTGVQFSETCFATTTWTGTTGNLWREAGNWDNGVPNNSLHAVVPNISPSPLFTSLSANQTEEVHNLTIQAGAVLNIAGGHGLIVNGHLNIDASGSMIINSFANAFGNGSLIVKGNATGNIEYRRAVESSVWHLISPPVVGQALDASWMTTNLISTGSNGNLGIANYNNSFDLPGGVITGWEYANSSSNTVFNSGQGYGLRRESSGNIIFSGTVKTNDSSFSMELGTQNAWNLVGNPYPSYINANSNADATNNLITFNGAALDPSHIGLYLWNPDTDSYTVINSMSPASYIAPGQGFFVHRRTSGMGPGGTFSISEAMQSHQLGDLFYRNTNSIPEVTVFMSNGTLDKSTQIKYVPNATTGLDPGYDAGLFTGEGNDFDIYTHLVSDSDGTGFMLQALPDSNYENMVIPIGINADLGEELIFTTNSANLPSGYYIYLEDRAAGSFIRLDEPNSEYIITLDAAEQGIGRFYLHTTTETLNLNSISQQSLSVYVTEGKVLRINGDNASDLQIVLHNILGQEVFKKKLTIQESRDVQLPGSVRAGIYLVQVVNDLGKVQKKIIIQ